VVAAASAAIFIEFPSISFTAYGACSPRFHHRGQVAASGAGRGHNSRIGIQRLDGTGKRILVIDDDLAIRVLLNAVLKRMKFEVDLAEEGTDGLEKVQRNAYDLVLLGLRMPGLSDYGFIEEVHGRLAVIPHIVVFTAAGKRGVEKIRPGAICNSILKPFDLDPFLEIIGQCLQQEHPRPSATSAMPFAQSSRVDGALVSNPAPDPPPNDDDYQPLTDGALISTPRPPSRKKRQKAAQSREKAAPSAPEPPPPAIDEPATHPSAAEESVVLGHAADRASATDTLGFTPYVEAVADFLTSPLTEAPIALSIEGAWGSGKSSFMLQLREALQRRDPLVRLIMFNAWRHEKAEELWAAFTLHLIRQLRAQFTPLQRLVRDFRLAMARFTVAGHAVEIARTIVLLLAVLAATVAVPIIVYSVGESSVTTLVSQKEDAGPVLRSLLLGAGHALGIGGALVTLAAALTFWRSIVKNFASPLEVDLKKCLRMPDYDAKLAFIERFHEDLDRVLDAYLDRPKLFIFIDDLDRCDVPHAADLMQALNLMFADRGPLVFIIGMDREKIAAGLAVKFEKLLPYIGSRQGADPQKGIAFGYDFIEKFIQTRFVVPRPTGIELEGMIGALTPAEAAPASTPAGSTDANAEAKAALDAEVERGIRDFVRLETRADSPTVRRIVAAVAPVLGRNPRRLKHFVNLFRLRALIANRTGLFAGTMDTPARERLTLEKLGKFVALEMRWPLLLAEAERSPKLIAELERAATGAADTLSPEVQKWIADGDLLRLLRFGISEGAITDEYSLDTYDIQLLLDVAPRLR
jgi:CheY-like chemotaxis protein